MVSRRRDVGLTYTGPRRKGGASCVPIVACPHPAPAPRPVVAITRERWPRRADGEAVSRWLSDVPRISAKHPLELGGSHEPARPPTPFLLSAGDPYGAQPLPQSLALLVDGSSRHVGHDGGRCRAAHLASIHSLPASQYADSRSRPLDDSFGLPGIAPPLRDVEIRASTDEPVSNRSATCLMDASGIGATAHAVMVRSDPCQLRWHHGVVAGHRDTHITSGGLRSRNSHYEWIAGG